jgi:hypothetical protein
MAVQWNQQLLEEFFAPGISEFTEANLPDLRDKHPEADHWIANHFLGSVFRGRWSPDAKASVINVLFRARNAFNSYHRGRELTLGYLGLSQPQNPSSGAYFDAIASWETTLLQVQHAQDVMRCFGGEAFQQGDGSDDERLWLLANKIKHCGGDIKRGAHTSDFTIPMWMTNDGLVSREARVRLSWEEVAEHVDALASAADELQDPAGMIEKYRPA